MNVLRFLGVLVLAAAAVQVNPQPVAAQTALPADAGLQQELARLVQAPEGFDVTVFATPPVVTYPTAITAAPTGELFVAIDKNSSLDQERGRGSILRLVDEDGDGVADTYTAFVDSVDSPRGLIYDGETLYVMHPPTLSAFRDTDGDGVADASEVLVRGLGFDLDFRGADHTTNGMTMGIDGWIYIAVGDYGFLRAVGTDGKQIQHRGGGIVRVRPDGSDIELFAEGLRNAYDIAIDPYLNGFVRGNTNDGGGWDVRLNHIVSGAHYGYPSLFKNFSDEAVAPLADYGGGSGTGALFLHDAGFPEPYGHTLYTVDWGRSMIYRHPLQPSGATFDAEQELFLEIPRPTDVVIDGNSHMYVSSWYGGRYRYDDEHVGYIVRLTVPGQAPSAFPDVQSLSDAELVDVLAAPNQVHRMYAQHEILRRGAQAGLIEPLEELVLGEAPVYARVAAIFTLKQAQGAASHDVLLQAAEDPDVRAYALRALADRMGELENVPAEPFLEALNDPDPQVQLQAVIGLRRLGAPEAAAALLPLTASSDPVVAHVAVDALVKLRARDESLQALETGSPEVAAGALRVLQELHSRPTVVGLIDRLEQTRDPALRQRIVQALARLYNRDSVWLGEWWGTRPSTLGPYYDPVAWAESARILPVLEEELMNAEGDALATLLDQLARNRVLPAGSQGLLRIAASEDSLKNSLIGAMLGHAQVTPEMQPLLARLSDRGEAYRTAVVALFIAQDAVPEAALPLLQDAAMDTQLDPELRSQVLVTLAESADQEGLPLVVEAFAQVEPGPDLPPALDRTWRQFISARQHIRNVPFFADLAQSGTEAERVLAYAVLLQIAGREGLPPEARLGADQAVAEAWTQPASAVHLLHAIGLTRSRGYADQVRARLEDSTPSVQQAATVAAEQLNLSGDAGADQVASVLVRNLPYEELVHRVNEIPGDAELGQRLFMQQACVACHTASPEETLKGPFLGGIAERYSRTELVESIVRPNAQIAQGFTTHWFTLTDGSRVEGFVVREAGDEVEIRNQVGAVTVLPKARIAERGKRDGSLMPQGLVDNLTVDELAALLAYLESLNTSAGD